MRQRKRVKKEPSETLSKESPEEFGDGDVDGENKGFYACYLLVSLSPRHKGHTYIGFTVNPRRRIRQHNGEIGCGAWRTKKRRPWEMVLCIYGFPSNVSALQFEWAWQHPKESLAVRKAAVSFKSLSGIVNKIKLAYTMLTLPSWQSLNITVNYFSTKYTKHCGGCPSLPRHMKVKICPMDELPCYVEGCESLVENDDGLDDEEPAESSGSQIAEEILSDSMSGNAEHSKSGLGDEVADGLYGWTREENCREEPMSAELSERPSSNGSNSCTFVKEFANGTGISRLVKNGSFESKCLAKQSSEFVTIDDDQPLSSLTMSVPSEVEVIDLMREEEEDCREESASAELSERPSSDASSSAFIGEFTDYSGVFGLVKDSSFAMSRPAKEPPKLLVTVDDDQPPSSYTVSVPSEVEVIDVTTPSPLCRSSLWGNKSCGGGRNKERRIVSNEEAEVIDLTTPSPLCRNSLWSDLLNYE